jgi:hypothetical protein
LPWRDENAASIPRLMVLPLSPVEDMRCRTSPCLP